MKANYEQNTGTLEQKEERNERKKKTEDDFISLEKIAKEMSEEKYETGREYKYDFNKSFARSCNRAFVKNLSALLGKDYSVYLKNKTIHYKIPKKSKEFVKRLIEPDETFLKIIQGEVFFEGIGVLEVIDDGGIEKIVTKDTELSETRLGLYTLFEECDSNVRDEVMETFYKKYNPYYIEIKNGIDKLQKLFDKIVTSPHMDTASSRALYDDVERCIQDIYYAQKRSMMLWWFDKSVAESLRAIEYAARIQ